MPSKLDSIPPLPEMRRRLQASHPYESVSWVEWKVRQRGLVFLSWLPLIAWVVTGLFAFGVLGAAIALASLVCGNIAAGKRK